MYFLTDHWKAIITGLILGGFMFLFQDTFLATSLSADLQIPFPANNAGLAETDANAINLATEGAPDAGAEAIVGILSTLFYYLKLLLGIFVITWIVYAGVQILATAGNEEKVENSKRIVLYGISSLVVMLLAEPLVLDIFYGGGDAGVSYLNTGINDLESAQDNIRIQLDGILQFFKTLLIFTAMGYVINVGVRMILAFGSDDLLTNAKGMFMPIVYGILMILFNEVFIDYIIYDIAFDGEEVEFSADSSNAQIFVEQLVGFLQYVLQFLGLIVFGFLIYGGMLYIISFGNEETAEKGKNIFINAFIAMFIILISYILMWSLVNFELSV